jgi:hypothetical protein
MPRACTCIARVSVFDCRCERVWICAQISQLKDDGVEGVCFERLRMTTVSYKCGNRKLPYDGEYMKTLVYSDQVVDVTDDTIDATGCHLEVRMCLPLARGGRLCVELVPRPRA